MKPLESITVLEFSTMITASLASMMMAEQGARVIKVEPIGMGDPMRYLGARKGDISALFANCNRGKESLRLDLQTEEGQDVIRRLMSEVDVLVHNFRPGVMDKLTLGSESLRALNPRLIYCAISGFGTEGPLSGAAAYDPMIQAHAGIAATQGREGEPVFMKTLMCDKITGYTACQAITSALFMRERTGEGQHIDLSMLDSSLFFMFLDGFQNHTLLSEDHERGPLLVDFMYAPWPASDGALTISCGNYETQARFLNAIGMSHLLEDDRFDTYQKQLRNIVAFREAVREACCVHTADELVRLLRAADVPCAKCLSRDEVIAQEQVLACGTLDTYEHPVVGELRRVLSPPKFGGERLSPASGAPTHGEHTDSVLRSFGYSDSELIRLRENGAVG
jgi:crotonobetainyl-CoA:carnitine CoA-transferase CaiB-like acyl-CoA transferase